MQESNIRSPIESVVVSYRISPFHIITFLFLSLEERRFVFHSDYLGNPGGGGTGVGAGGGVCFFGGGGGGGSRRGS
jgi:hypothetical protein